MPVTARMVCHQAVRPIRLSIEVVLTADGICDSLRHGSNHGQALRPVHIPPWTTGIAAEHPNKVGAVPIALCEELSVSVSDEGLTDHWMVFRQAITPNRQQCDVEAVRCCLIDQPVEIVPIVIVWPGNDAWCSKAAVLKGCMTSRVNDV